MTWAKFISVDYKHFFRMFFCPKCLSAGGQIGAVLENEVTCNDKCEDILLQILFLPSPDVSDQFWHKFQNVLGEAGQFSHWIICFAIFYLMFKMMIKLETQSPFQMIASDG